MSEKNNESLSHESTPVEATPVESTTTESNKLTIQNPDVVGYIEPIFNDPVPEINRLDSIIEYELRVEIYNRARIVKFFSIIDMCFIIAQLLISIYFNTTNWIVFLFFPFCYAGYSGAKNYIKSNILGYTCYLSIMSILYLIMTFTYFNFFYLIMFFIEIYILNFTVKLLRLLDYADADINNIITSLQNGWIPEQNLIVLYYY